MNRCGSILVALGLLLCGRSWAQGLPGSSPRPLLPDPGATPSELILRDFLYMRQTSPNPNRFFYGRLNPVPAPPPVSGGYYPYPYPGPYYPYPYPQGYGYGGIYTPYGGVVYGPASQVYQREVIIVREGRTGASTGEPYRRPAAGTPEPGTSAKPVEPAPRGGFYLDRKEGEALPDALDDLRKAWLNGDFERLRARFQAGRQVKIYPKGKYAYSVEAAEFTAVLKDAMARIDTLSFELERPKSEQAGRVFVSGKHVFLDGATSRQETHVSYLLEKVEGSWKIVEAGSSGAAILKHEE